MLNYIKEVLHPEMGRFVQKSFVSYHANGGLILDEKSSSLDVLVKKIREWTNLDNATVDTCISSSSTKELCVFDLWYYHDYLFSQGLNTSLRIVLRNNELAVVAVFNRNELVDVGQNMRNVSKNFRDLKRMFKGEDFLHADDVYERDDHLYVECKIADRHEVTGKWNLSAKEMKAQIIWSVAYIYCNWDMPDFSEDSIPLR